MLWIWYTQKSTGPLVTRTGGISFIVSGAGQAKQVLQAKVTRQAQKP